MIFKKLLSDKKLHLPITETLLKHLEFSLENDPLSSEEYFNLLTQLLTQSNLEEVPSLSLEDRPDPRKIAKDAGLILDVSRTVVEIDQKSKNPPQTATKTLEITEDTKRHFS